MTWVRAIERLRAPMARGTRPAPVCGHCDSGGAERGESLIELLIALVIMGIAVVAIVGGIATSIMISDLHRKQATAGADIRSYAEFYQSEISDPFNKYIACGTAADYQALNMISGHANTDDRYQSDPTTYHMRVSAVQYWNGTSFVPTCNTDTGVQRLSLQVSSNDGRATESLDVEIRQACGVSDSPCS